MPTRLVALDEGNDIPLDRSMVVVGRHPQCDARLDSLRVSRHHCCMTRDKNEILVRDLGSTNGIRINGQRVDAGRLRPGDELSIAHIRYKFEDTLAAEATLAESHISLRRAETASGPLDGPPLLQAAGVLSPAMSPLARGLEGPLAAAVREMLPLGMAGEHCRIQVIVQVQNKDSVENAPGLVVAIPVPSSVGDSACRPASSH